MCSDGSVVAWGSNTSGQCNVPMFPPGVVCLKVEATWRNTVALLSDGSILEWGANGGGECNVPPLPTGVRYVDLASGFDQSCALRSDGTLVSWGVFHGTYQPPSPTLGSAVRAHRRRRSLVPGDVFHLRGLLALLPRRR
ncbi:MAG: hypothetical protein IPJ19_14055 [Planctomycetes bacterium]|nr:hypothetical protein [Planctomycetota bacterium]